MKKSVKKLTLNRETIGLAHATAGVATLVKGCQTGIGGGCGSSSPPATCPPA